MEVADIRPVKFETRYVRNEDGTHREVDWVEYARRGDAKYQVTPARIRDIQKIPGLWEPLRPHYEAWRRGQSYVDDGGTPLAAWAGLTREQMEVIKAADVHSVESLAGLSDSQRDRIGLPGMVSIQQAAKRFLDSRSSAKVETALAQKDEEIAALRAQMEMLIESMAPRGDDEEPARRRGPGRPRKEESAQDAA